MKAHTSHVRLAGGGRGEHSPSDHHPLSQSACQSLGWLALKTSRSGTLQRYRQHTACKSCEDRLLALPRSSLTKSTSCVRNEQPTRRLQAIRSPRCNRLYVCEIRYVETESQEFFALAVSYGPFSLVDDHCSNVQAQIPACPLRMPLFRTFFVASFLMIERDSQDQGRGLQTNRQFSSPNHWNFGYSLGGSKYRCHAQRTKWV